MVIRKEIKNITNITDRKKLKNDLIGIFLEEEPGNGNKEKTSKYEYIVEKSDDHEIYLKRPAPLNKGMDFVIYTNNYNFAKNGSRARRNPSHKDILEDLSLKKSESNSEYEKLISKIDNIFLCKEEANNDNDINLKRGIPVDLLLKIIKWLFIEQDVTYWNYSGRKKLKEEIDKI